MTLNSVNVDETAEVNTKLDNNQIVSEIVQASNSAQTDDQEDQEVDDAEIDKIVVNKVIREHLRLFKPHFP